MASVTIGSDYLCIYIFSLIRRHLTFSLGCHKDASIWKCLKLSSPFPTPGSDTACSICSSSVVLSQYKIHPYLPGFLSQKLANHFLCTLHPFSSSYSFTESCVSALTFSLKYAYFSPIPQPQSWSRHTSSSSQTTPVPSCLAFCILFIPLSVFNTVLLGRSI